MEKRAMKNLGALLVGLLLVAAPAFAADVDGSWTGTIATPMGDFPVAFTFKADGATLTGSMQGMDGAQLPIKNGKIDGNKISFSVSLDFGGMPLELSYAGVVSPAEIKFQGEAAGMPFELVVTKTK
jgi:hypothetical protein